MFVIRERLYADPVFFFFYGGVHVVWFLSFELASCHLSHTYNFDVVHSSFKICGPLVYKILDSSENARKYVICVISEIPSIITTISRVHVCTPNWCSLLTAKHCNRISVTTLANI
jgi:hypothetical protein